jgi:heme/copper-type cytochrome/quinol oxidase subunit 4
VLLQGTLFLQMDNDQEGTVQRAAAIYFSLIICNLISFGTYTYARVSVSRARSSVDAFLSARLCLLL